MHSFCPGLNSFRGKWWSIRLKSYIGKVSIYSNTKKRFFMTEENGKQAGSEDEYTFDKLEEGSKDRPKCVSCGDPVKLVVHSGGHVMAAQHCKECYAELRWGKIPKYRRRRH
jgi:hypothetical protein